MINSGRGVPEKNPTNQQVCPLESDEVLTFLEAVVAFEVGAEGMVPQLHPAVLDVRRQRTRLLLYRHVNRNAILTHNLIEQIACLLFNLHIQINQDSVCYEQ